MKVGLIRWSLLVPLLVLLGGGAIASPARASDRIYWTSFDSGTVQWANLDGSGGIHELNPGEATISPNGYGMGGAIDPVQGRYYWANQEQGKILWANLDGSGGGDLPTGSATVSGPDGISVDPIGRRVYWSNEGKISYANLDGSGGGDLATGSASVDHPHGTTVYPALGRVYWTNWNFIGDGSIAFAATNGSGGATLPAFGTATIDTPFGLAIDAAAGRMYWPNDNPGIVSFAALDGSADADIDNRGLKMVGPYGIAFDPETHRAYTANFAGDDLTYLGVDGNGGATVPVTLPKESGPNFPVLYEEPRARSAPSLESRPPPVARPKKKKGRRHPPAQLPKLIGTRLTCRGDAWAADLVEARLYRAPTAVSRAITREGAPVGQQEAVANEPGNYRCTVTASNLAGSVSQTTGEVAIFATGKAKLDEKKGTAKLTVLLPAEKGRLALSAKGFKGASKEAAGTAVVLVKPQGAKKRKLARKGKLRTVVRLTYAPPDGPPATLRSRLTLKQR